MSDINERPPRLTEAPVFDTEEMGHMYVKIVGGTAKEDYGPMTAEASAWWDRVAAQVAELRAQGKDDFYFPWEPPA